ncbi:MAG TPA: response regulator [Kofleriaceae bacterium]|jgi:CheY-like chemotaxis protein|nr:response regulator [Kofleriaceae bacterium]
MQPAVLIVDDDADIREALEEVLSESGYAVAIAADGADALDEMKAHAPALVLLDLMMPNVDGWRVMDEMHRDPSLCGIPVCVLSAFAELAPAAADTVLAKPIKVLPLLETVERFCGRPTS